MMQHHAPYDYLNETYIQAQPKQKEIQ